MSILNAFFIFLLVWWTMIFTVLPLGVERHEEAGKGFDAGAPKHPDLKKKVIINTVISLTVVAVIWVLVDTGVITWGSWFREAIQ